MNRFFDLIINFYENNLIVRTYQLCKLRKYLETVGLDRIINFKPKYDFKPKMLKENSRFKNEIEDFENVLKNNFNITDMVNYYYNIEWVKITYKNISKENYRGVYNVGKNKLVIYKNKSNVTIYHELFHLASTNTTHKDYSTGFSFLSKDMALGDTLNEGYTELLATRYFNKECYEKLNFGDHNFESRVALNLEKIVGMEKMQSLYMNSNLKGLIKELEQYYTTNEIEQFLTNLDVITLYTNNLILPDIINDELNFVMENVICFLVKGYCKKLLKENNSEEENIKLLEEYLNILNMDWNGITSDYEYNIDRINLEISQVLNIKLDLDVLKKDKTCYNK